MLSGLPRAPSTASLFFLSFDNSLHPTQFIPSLIIHRSLSISRSLSLLLSLTLSLSFRHPPTDSLTRFDWLLIFANSGRVHMYFLLPFYPVRYVHGGLCTVRVHRYLVILLVIYSCDGYYARAHAFVGLFPPVPSSRRVTVCVHAYVLACYVL